jgi:hypothetical protein
MDDLPALNKMARSDIMLYMTKVTVSTKKYMMGMMLSPGTRRKIWERVHGSWRKRSVDPIKELKKSRGEWK